MRNIVEVADKMLAVIPVSEEGLRDGIEDIVSSVRYSPPESMGMWWTEFTYMINDYLPHSLEELNDWQKRVAFILMDREGELTRCSRLVVQVEQLRDVPTQE